MKRLLTACCLLLPGILLGPFSVASAGQTSPEEPLRAPLVKNRAPLSPSAFYLLPLTSIKPKGWLRQQLQIQADGLSGHIDEFWPDLSSNSGWLGGKGESWERGPYFTDGLVPLAYSLGDPKLIAKANKWVEWTLTHQRPDGSIGPEKNTDWWPNMVMLKALIQYQEATSDPRVIPLMERYFRYHAAHLTERPLKSWAKFRWADEVLSILWLYNRDCDQSLLELARALQSQGHDWKGEFASFPFTAKTTQKQLGLGPGADTEVAMSAHGVNIGMALKTSGQWLLISQDESDRKAVYQQLEKLDEFHKLPNGMFSCDEHLAGTDPSQGSELCTVVETQFSLEQLIGILGDPALGDRLEKIAFNALPGTFSADMWAHQYDQQPNQVLCDLQQRAWSTNGPEANIYGLEPNYGCCTANMHQGWPKFAASLWMATPEDGLAAVAYAPSEVSTVVKKGVHVGILEETSYPFDGMIRLAVSPASPVKFPLQLRIPAWAEGTIILVNGSKQKEIRAGSFYTIERRWNRGDEVVIQFPMQVRVSPWIDDSVVVERGPLVFSLKIGEQWSKITKGMGSPAAPPAADWAVAPTTPWNYGLLLNKSNPAKSIEVIQKSVGRYPFSPDGAPVELRVKGRRIPEWQLVKGSAGPLPASPNPSREKEETLTLIPYGSAKLRITVFPTLQH
jgi:hypothetical protein